MKPLTIPIYSSQSKKIGSSSTQSNSSPVITPWYRDMTLLDPLNITSPKCLPVTPQTNVKYLDPPVNNYSLSSSSPSKESTTTPTSDTPVVDNSISIFNLLVDIPVKLYQLLLKLM
jgi:hypothetical protein